MTIVDKIVACIVFIATFCAAYITLLNLLGG